MTVGLFDSGEGGVNLLYHLRKRNRECDVFLLCDRANSPYGTKSREELSLIVGKNITLLRRLGAEKIIAACCTACTALPYIEGAEGVASTLALTAERARELSPCGRIAVLATDATVRSGAFSDALGGDTLEIAAQPLVRMIEDGARDGNIGSSERDYLEALLEKCRGAEAIILGCTHFSSLRGEITRLAEKHGIRTVVDSAEVGASSVERSVGSGGMSYIINTRMKKCPNGRR